MKLLMLLPLLGPDIFLSSLFSNTLSPYLINHHHLTAFKDCGHRLSQF